MNSPNDSKDIISFSSVMSTCEKRGKWQLAVALFKALEQTMRPNVVTYSALMSAYETRAASSA